MTAYPGIDGTQPCKDDPELFFDYDGRGTWKIPHAVTACRRCPFIRDCLGYALTNDVAGIWGGTTWAQRKQLRATHAIQAEPVTVSDIELRRERVAALDLDEDQSARTIATQVGVTPRTITRYRRRTA